MPQLLILDPSLKGPGGHHFDYTRQVVRASRRAGSPVIVATHLAFDRVDLLLAEDVDLGASLITSGNPQRAPAWVLPTFRRTTYNACSDLPGVRTLAKSGRSLSKRVLTQLGKLCRTSLARTRRSPHFEQVREAIQRLSKADREHWTSLDSEQREVVCTSLEDLMQLFGNGLVQASNHSVDVARLVVFHTTMSELEFLALALGFNAGLLPQMARWNLQFHFDLFWGRPHEYSSQRSDPRIQRVEKTFELAARLSAEQPLALYATSEPLAEQYNRLKVGEFEPLDYPINPSFQPLEAAQRMPNEPVRITLAGGVRVEKGQQGLDTVVANLQESVLRPEAGKLVVQRRRRSKWRRPQLVIPPELTGPQGRWIQYADHPLSEADYVELIRAAGVGLLLYDGRTYYSRRAGVLGEFFASGVPVVVPAASWLSEQVEHGNRSYWKRMANASGELLTPETSSTNNGTSSAHWSLPIRSLTKSDLPDAGFIVAEIRLRQPLDHLKHLRFQWEASSQTSNDISVSPNSQAATSSVAPQILKFAVDSGIVGRDANQVWAAFPLEPLAVVDSINNARSSVRFATESRSESTNASTAPCTVQVQLQWAFDTLCPLTIDSAQFTLVTKTTEGNVIPWGSLGWVVSDFSQVSCAVAQIVRHVQHYQDQTRSYAPIWQAAHDPQQTFQKVMGSSLAKLNVA